MHGKRAYELYRKSLPRDMVERINDTVSDPRYERAFEELEKPDYVIAAIPIKHSRHSRVAGFDLKKTKRMIVNVGIYARDKSYIMVRVFLKNFNKFRPFKKHIESLDDKAEDVLVLNPA